MIDLQNIPNALFIIGLNKEKTATKEARRMGIPIISICNTNSDPSLIDCLILGNDRSEKSVNFLVSKVAEVIRESKLKRSVKLPEGEDNNEVETKR